ncbi:RNA ligase [Naegleria gruberi]|uniref:RNA ligase n=1 Tax=Naegleria gruberi TaxID=5762 RepID=D2W189_NAEGR|nr:RNA ligase [Naegleria gruberi]EFC37142.1 RNA ligase [Naegleria gruberi]|eukprot:XP_002669886.1 RNA ligase [Naegleria gruberi]
MSAQSISFSKYTKFDNHYRKQYVESIKTQNEEMSKKLNHPMEWYCSEKVHGCNLSFIVDRVRQSDWRKSLSGELNEQLKLKSVQIYGELFGGLFPNKKPSDAKAIQSGIHYCPHHDFYAFDVLLGFENGKQSWAVFNNVDPLLDECGFKVRAQPLFKGTLDECLEFDVKFNTKLPETFYPEIVKERNASWKDLDNICEGVVIKPTKYNIFVETERAVIKKKNEKFLETEASDKPQQPVKKEKGDSEELVQVWNELSRYITSNRLDNVLSKIGNLTKSNMFPVMKEFSNDALEEFKLDLERGALENCKPVSSLSSEDQKKLTKKINDACMVLIKEQLNKPSSE